MRIIDTETEYLVNSPRGIKRGGRRDNVDELTNQSQRSMKDKRDSLRSSSDGKSPSVSGDRIRTKLDGYEKQLDDMRPVMDKLVC